MRQLFVLGELADHRGYGADVTLRRGFDPERDGRKRLVGASETRRRFICHERHRPRHLQKCWMVMPMSILLEAQSLARANNRTESENLPVYNSQPNDAGANVAFLLSGRGGS